MAFSMDQRLPPLGDSFFAFEPEVDAHGPDAYDDASSTILALNLRRSRSVPGYIPHYLHVLFASQQLQLGLCDSDERLVETWPDTDDEFNFGSAMAPLASANYENVRQTSPVGSLSPSDCAGDEPATRAPSGVVGSIQPKDSASVATDGDVPQLSKLFDSSINDIWPDTDDESIFSVAQKDSLSSVSAHKQPQAIGHSSLPQCKPQVLQPLSLLVPVIGMRKQGMGQRQVFPLASHDVGPCGDSRPVLKLAEIMSPTPAQSSHHRNHQLPLQSLLATCPSKKQTERSLGKDVSAVPLAEDRGIVETSLGGPMSQTFAGDIAMIPKEFEHCSILHKITKGEATTLMIRNLPESLLQNVLLAELDNSGFENKYDFCFLPSLFSPGGGSKGFAFANFVSAEVAVKFVSEWHLTHRFGMRPECVPINISVATLQGFEANVAKWKTSRIQRIKNPQLRPFVRPRLGTLLK